jgi:hypothetical protein
MACFGTGQCQWAGIVACHGRFLGAALEHNDLMPQRQDLHLEGGARAED